MLWRSLKLFDQHNSFCFLRRVHTWHHGGKICVPKQWNGDHVLILNEWHWGFYQNSTSLASNQRLGSLAYNYKSAFTIRTYFHVIIDISRKMWSRVVPAKVYLKTRAMVSFYIVSRGNWLWKVANIKKKKEKTSGTAVYVGSSQTVYNPLFFVHKLRWNKVMRRFYSSERSKW